MQRLTNPNSPAYANFKTAGITCDSRWIDFDKFLADMGTRAPGLVLRRHDLNKGFCKTNCYWGAPPIPRPFTSGAAKQALRIARKLAPGSGRKRYGRPKSMRSLRARALAQGVNPHLVYSRIRAGWSKWNALNVPAARRRKQRAILLSGETRPDPDKVGGGPPAPGAEGSAGFSEVGEATKPTGRARALVGRKHGEATEAAIILGEPCYDLSEIETLLEGHTRMVVWLSLRYDLGLRTCKSMLERHEWNPSAVVTLLEKQNEDRVLLADPTHSVARV